MRCQQLSFGEIARDLGMPHGSHHTRGRTVRPSLEWIGKNIKRVEDPRLLTGQGRYIDDIELPNTLHPAVLRSTRAHARIRSIDVSAAAALPGVVKVLTGVDIARTTGPLPCFSNPPVEQRCAAVRRVRHVGEALRWRWPRAATSLRTRSI
jgi:CO/xanthine dehydrogenase Mo-binding subunit